MDLEGSVSCLGSPECSSHACEGEVQMHRSACKPWMCALPIEELSTSTSKHSKPVPSIPSFGDPNQLCTLATNVAGKGSFSEPLLRRALRFATSSRHPKVERELVNRKLDTGYGVESSSRKSSPPPPKGISRRPPNNRNTSPPPC